jgi:hypothetical protein
MAIIPVKICYLCGKYILPEHESNEDHIVPKVLLDKKPLKTMGFDHGGMLITHKECNDKFGEASSRTEVLCRKALSLLSVLYDENCSIKRFYKGDPKLGLWAIDSSFLKGFSKKEMEFFKINDGRNKDYKSWCNISSLMKMESVDPLKIPANIALSVLAKSASALLVTRFEVLPDSYWRIAVYPGLDKDNNIDLDHLFGQIKPFDIGVKVWIRKLGEIDYLLVYKHNLVIAFYHFNFLNDDALQEGLPTLFAKENIFQYKSKCLLNLINYDWFNNPL